MDSLTPLDAPLLWMDGEHLAFYYFISSGGQQHLEEVHGSALNPFAALLSANQIAKIILHTI